MKTGGPFAALHLNFRPPLASRTKTALLPEKQVEAAGCGWEHPVGQGPQAGGDAAAASGRRALGASLSLAAGTCCVIVLGLGVQALVL